MAQIPEDWTISRLGEVGDVLMCKRVLKSQTSPMGEIPFYKIGTFGQKPDAFIPRELFTRLRKTYSYPKDGDILVSAAGTIGRTVVFDGSDSYFQDSNIVWLGNDERRVLNSYLHCWYQVVKWTTEDGGIVSRLYNDNFKAMTIAFPDIPEQRRIADALGAVDKLIDNLTRRIEKKRQVKQGVMQVLLTGKKRLPGFKGSWSTRTLGSVGQLLKGSGLSKAQVGLYGKHKCILYGDLFTKYRLQVKTCFGKTNSDEGLLSRNGDVLVPGSTTTEGIDLATATCVCEDGIRLGGDIIVIRNSFQAFEPLFLAAVISFINREAIAEVAQGTTIVHLHPGQLSSICYTMPDDTAEQRAIATVLSDMDAEIAKLEAKRDKYVQIKQGMMNDLLTGRIRI